MIVASLTTKRSTRALLGGTFAVVGAVAIGVVVLGRGEDTASPSLNTGSGPEDATKNRPVVVRRGSMPAKKLIAHLPERSPEEELWSMPLDQYGQAEIQRWDFEIQGGIESPGTDPDGARLELDDLGWSANFEEELEQGLDEIVLTRGVEIDRVACDRGRCLVELGYDGMERALERVAAVRRWLTERVRCRAFTDGPYEGDSPSVLPTQQIWILCGEPESSPYRSR